MKKFRILVKRLFDILFSILGILLCIPLFLGGAILIKLSMPGPIFFRQERVGKNGKIFFILKFRTMKTDKNAELNHDTSKDERRITTLGRVMRRIKMDELPQMFNVLKGDMSLVGPRPTFKEQADLYDTKQQKRLSMRPGMTGLAQVNGNIAISWNERIEYDLNYIEHFSLCLDVKILLKTVLVIMFGEQYFKGKSRREK